MLTLYHSPKTRSSRFIWLLDELGTPYEIKLVGIRRRDEGARDPANPHPHGKVPAIVHDGALVFESAAIALYLTDAFPAAGIGPLVGDPKRGAYLSWLAYYTGVMEPAFVGKALGFTTTNSTTGWAPTDDVLGHIHAALQKGPYLLGEKFSAADVLFGSTLLLFGASPLVPQPERFKPYVERLTARPAYIRAQAKDEGLK